jgi:hypothetical protein
MNRPFRREPKASSESLVPSQLPPQETSFLSGTLLLSSI